MLRSSDDFFSLHQPERSVSLCNVEQQAVEVSTITAHPYKSPLTSHEELLLGSVMLATCICLSGSKQRQGKHCVALMQVLLVMVLTPIMT
jgi:hypothetical protein